MNSENFTPEQLAEFNRVGRQIHKADPTTTRPFIYVEEKEPPTLEHLDALRCTTNRTASTRGIVMTESEAEIVRRFPIGLPVEAAVRSNSDVRYGQVVGHRLCSKCEVCIVVDTGGRQPHPFDHRRLRPIHGDQRLTIPSGKPGLIVRLLSSLWNALS